MFSNIRENTLRYLLNHFCESYLARPIESDEFRIVDRKIIWNNIYLNIEKINAILAEKNVPILVNVAFISEIIAEFPMKFELTDLEIIAQTTCRHFTPLDGDMVNSLISSVTAFAFAAAKVGVEADLSSDAVDSQSVLNIIDKFDSFMRIFSLSESETSGLVDRVSVEKGGHLIDNLLFKASVKFNNLSIRLQCPLELSSLCRACDLRLKFQCLEIDNVVGDSANKKTLSSTSGTDSATSAQPDQSTEVTPLAELLGNRWWSNWFTSWFSGDSSDKTANEFPEVARKLLRLDGVTLHWDLWDTTKEKNNIRSISGGSISASENDSNPSQNEWLLGPDRDSMIASACLLSLPSEENYLTLQILRTRDRFSVISIHPTLIDLNADLDCIFAALCPSQLFWLKATITQLTKYVQAFCSLRSAENAEDTDSNSNILERPSKVSNLVGSDEPCALATNESSLFQSCIEDSCLISDQASHPSIFTLSVRCRLFSITIFHGDEEASFPVRLSDSNSLEDEHDSSSSEEHFHEVLSSNQDPSFTFGALKCQNALFSALETNQDGIKDLIFSDRTSVATAEWLESINSAFTKFIEGRDHLRLSVGHFEAELKAESYQLPPDEMNPDEEIKGMEFPSEGPFVGQIGGLLFSECLFSHGSKDPNPEITQILTVFDINSPLLPAVRLRGSSSPSHFELAPCHLELDPSLVDRLHRTFDAFSASTYICEMISHAIDEASGLRDVEYDSGKIRKWLSGAHSSDEDESSQKQPADKGNQSLFFGLLHMSASCPSLHVTVRIPIPIETVPSLFGEDISMIRERLWSATNSSPLAWWKPNLRSESLHLSVTDFNFHAGDTRTSNPSDITYSVGFNRLQASFIGGMCDGAAFLTLDDPSNKKLARVTLHLSQKAISDRDLPLRDRKSRGHSMEDSVEEELYSTVFPKGGVRCPFEKATIVIDRNLQNFWGKNPLAPGDTERLNEYRKTASENAALHIEAAFFNVEFHPSDERIINLLNSRLFTDLLLWRSLLPTNPKTRSFLQIGGGVHVPYDFSDHRFWFFAEESSKSFLVRDSSYTPTPVLTDSEVQESSLSTSVFITLFVKSLEIRIPLVDCQNPTGAISSTAYLSVRSLFFTTEVKSLNKSNPLYTTLTADKVEFRVTDSFLQNLNTSDNTIDIDFSLLMPLLPQTGRRPKVPMLTLILEKRSIPVYGPLEPLAPGTADHLTIAFTLQNGVASYLPFIQSWLERLPQLQIGFLAEDYPSLICPEYIIRTYGYLQTFALQMPPVCAFKAFVDKKARVVNASPGLDAVRPLLFTKRVSVVSKSQPFNIFVGSLENSEFLLIPPSNAAEPQSPPKAPVQALLEALLKESSEARQLFSETFPKEAVRVMTMATLQFCLINKESAGQAPCVDFRVTNDVFQVTSCIDSLVAIQIILNSFCDPPQSNTPTRSSSMPVLQSTPFTEEIARRLSSAMSDIEVSVDSDQPVNVKVFEGDGGFLVIHNNLSTASERVPLTVLEDGTKVMTYSKPVNFDVNFYSVNPMGVQDSGHRVLFSDPPGSATTFALTLYDVSIEVRLLGGLDFPYLAANVKECFQQAQQTLYHRRSDEGVNLKISKIYFRKSIFVPPENMKAEQYRSFREFRGSYDKPHPVTRYVLRVGDVRIIDELRESSARHLLYFPSGTRTFQNQQRVEALRFSVLLWPSHRSFDFEAEAKASIQPLNIVLDQVMLNFLRGHHESLKKVSELNFKRLELYISLLHPPVTNSSVCESKASTDDFSDDGDQPIFIRKFTFSPKLLIHFDYRGRQLDMSKGAVVGFLAMCLQLKNAELVLPSKVYQKGYLGVSSLVEEVTGHWMKILIDNLPQMVITNFGPMHEISLITSGIRDFCLHVVNAFREPLESSFHGRKIRGQYGRRAKLFSRESTDHVVRGLRNGVRALATNSVWPLIDLSSLGLHTTQYFVETFFDILNPGPPVRTRNLIRIHPSRTSCRQMRSHRSASNLSDSREPQNLGEGVARAVEAVWQGVANLAEDFSNPIIAPDPSKGSVGAIGDVLRQIPPTSVLPLVIASQVGSHLLDGFRNQFHPETKREEEEKWKDRGES